MTGILLHGDNHFILRRERAGRCRDIGRGAIVGPRSIAGLSARGIAIHGARRGAC